MTPTTSVEGKRRPFIASQGVVVCEIPLQRASFRTRRSHRQPTWKGDEVRKITLFALITAAVSLVAASFAVAQTTFKLKAALNIGQETTRVKDAKAGAAGSFSATLDGTTLKWKLTFKNFSAQQLLRISTLRRAASLARSPCRCAHRARHLKAGRPR